MGNHARRAILLSLLWLSGCAEYPWGVEEDGFVKVELDLTSRLPLIKVIVDGLGPHWFVLDSGAPMTVLNTWFAEDWADERQITTPSKVVQLGSIEIGSVTIEAHAARVEDLSQLERSIGVEVAGRLAMSVFRDYLITLDYPNGWLVMSKTSLPPANGVEVFDSIGVLVPQIVVRIDGREVHVLLDTANPQAVMIERRFQSRALNMLLYPGEASWRKGRLNMRQVGRSPVNLYCGAYVFEHPYVVIDGGGVSFGHDLLEDFVVQFDGPNQRIALRRMAGHQVPALPLYSVGCAFRRQGMHWVVIDVLNDTAAVRSGFVAGDVVVEVEGQPAHLVSPRAWQRLLRQKEQIQLRVKKGSEEYDLVLPVYRLVPEASVPSVRPR